MAKKKCCNSCNHMAYHQHTGEITCTHPNCDFGMAENCKNFKHDFSCKYFEKLPKGKPPEENPAMAMFQQTDEGEEQLRYLEDLNGKEVDIYLSDGATMYTGKIVAYNIISITFERSYNGERMMLPFSQVRNIVCGCAAE